MKYQPLVFANLLDRVRIDWQTQCWNWKLYRTEDGYGRLSWNGRLRLAHRLSLHLFGKMPKRAFEDRNRIVMHKCDNPACINPDHLRIGTQLENIADRKAKGRCARKRLNIDPVTKRFIKVNHAR